MRFVQPKPFTFENGRRAVLFLHGFTGNSADCRLLARFLDKKGYTCHAVQYKGHGATPEELVKTGPEDWWKDVLEGYEFLQNKGYKEIAVAGLSLGGVFSLKLGYTVRVKGIITMSSPTYTDNEEALYKGVLQFAHDYKKREGKSEQVIEKEMEAFREKPLATINDLHGLVADVRNHLNTITSPTLVAQGRNDRMIEPNSANVIYNEVASEVKELRWYEESGHVITFDKERDKLHEDVYEFLEKLDWED